MKKRILPFLTCAAILSPISGFCMELDEDESNWCRFQVMRSATDQGTLLPGELGVFAEDNKLYFISHSQERREIFPCDDLTQGIDAESLDRMIKSLQGLDVAVAQEEEEEEGEEDPRGIYFKRREEGYETDRSIYTSLFTKITHEDREKLFCHALMTGYIAPGRPTINSQYIKQEVWRENKSTLACNPIYHIGTLNSPRNNMNYSSNKIVPFDILYNTAYLGEASFDLYLQDTKTASIIPLGQFHTHFQEKGFGCGMAFTQTSMAIPYSVEEGIFFMTSKDIWGHMDWRMDSNLKIGEFSATRFIHQGLPLSIEYAPNEDYPGTVHETRRWNNDFPVKFRDGCKIALEIKHHTYDYGCSFLDIYVNEKSESKNLTPLDELKQLSL